MAEPASRPQPKKTKPRAADDDEESQGPTEGTGMIAKNNKMEQVDSEIKETQGVLLKTMCVLVLVVCHTCLNRVAENSFLFAVRGTCRLFQINFPSSTSSRVDFSHIPVR
jgi:hypothetical protein